MSDKTNWRLLLQKNADPLDLAKKRDELLRLLPEDLVYETLHDELVKTFRYPLLAYPKKIVTFDFLKNPLVAGTLLGIKGQYLLFEEGVLNIRKFAGYSIQFLHA